MKGFRNVFAAGALGIILAVTGCQQYGTTNDTATRSNTANRGAVTSTRRTTTRNIRTNTARNASRPYVNNNLTRVNTGTGNRQSVTRGTANRYSGGAVTTNRARTLTTRGNAASSGLVNTDVYGRRTAGSVNNAPHSQMYTSSRSGQTVTNTGRNMGTNMSSRALNTTNTTNTTGSQFGDYNKDRAYSVTRGTSNVTGSASGSVRTGTDNTVVRKNFTEGHTGTRFAGTGAAISGNKSAVHNTTKSAHVTKSTATAKSTKKSNHTGTVKTAQSRATGTTKAKKPSNIGPTSNRGPVSVRPETGRTLAQAPANSAAATRSNNNANTGATRSNVSTGVNHNVNAQNRAGGTNLTGANNSSNLNNTAGTGFSVNNTASGFNRGSRIVGQSLSGSAHIANQGRSAGFSGNGAAISNNASRFSNAKRYSGLESNSNTKNRQRRSAAHPKFERTATRVEGGTGRTRGNTTAVNQRTANGSTAYYTNNAINNETNNANVNNMNNRYSYGRNRGMNDLVYNNMLLNSDTAYGRYGYDNMTIGNTYRNADLRNDFHNFDSYYGYNGVYGVNDVSQGGYSGRSSGINTGTFSGRGGYYGASHVGDNYGATRGYASGMSGTRSSSHNTASYGTSSSSSGHYGIR